MKSKSISRRDFMKGRAEGASVFMGGGLAGKPALTGENKKAFQKRTNAPWIIKWRYE